MKNCFITNQPDFYRDVIVEGEKIATIHAFSRNDLAVIDGMSRKRFHPDGSLEVILNATAIKLEKMRLALTGDKCGLVSKMELTAENLGNLDDLTYLAIENEINLLETAYTENREVISKNLKELSDSSQTTQDNT